MTVVNPKDYACPVDSSDSEDDSDIRSINDDDHDAYLCELFVYLARKNAREFVALYLQPSLSLFVLRFDNRLVSLEPYSEASRFYIETDLCKHPLAAIFTGVPYRYLKTFISLPGTVKPCVPYRYSNPLSILDDVTDLSGKNTEYTLKCTEAETLYTFHRDFRRSEKGKKRYRTVTYSKSLGRVYRVFQQEEPLHRLLSSNRTFRTIKESFFCHPEDQKQSFPDSSVLFPRKYKWTTRDYSAGITWVVEQDSDSDATIIYSPPDSAHSDTEYFLSSDSEIEFEDSFLGDSDYYSISELFDMSIADKDPEHHKAMKRLLNCDISDIIDDQHLIDQMHTIKEETPDSAGKIPLRNSVESVFTATELENAKVKTLRKEISRLKKEKDNTLRLMAKTVRNFELLRNQYFVIRNRVYKLDKEISYRESQPILKIKQKTKTIKTDVHTSVEKLTDLFKRSCSMDDVQVDERNKKRREIQTGCNTEQDDANNASLSTDIVPVKKIKTDDHDDISDKFISAFPKSIEQAKHRCSLCGKRYVDKKTFLNHIESHSGVTYSCDQPECAKKKPYRNKVAFKKHVQFHLDGNNYIFCKECPKKFEQKIHLQSHMATHRPPSHQCRFCTKKFTFKYELRKHERFGHSLVKTDQCNICKKFYSSPVALRDHMRKQHKSK